MSDFSLFIKVLLDLFNKFNMLEEIFNKAIAVDDFILETTFNFLPQDSLHYNISILFDK